ncbi:hypothetical protein THRCLA_00192 [Thraustotheca clavata]|uniref:Helicase C-terminal domain-containing protein n=1 Tax=Thraustotheca clavata TaxID=74557 RepID=A0A1W0AC43_9STRA|nr:hypothetical protein THRCLA_00192 [Thraustotheca clavata]
MVDHCQAYEHQHLHALQQTIVDRYNSDSEIQALLLTTAIGGLGLNLTSADTVIFIEHSWNPFTDLQAMDRAHRLGQTKTVMVYRLLAKGTIEEDVMTCQRFKTAMAAAVIGSDGNNEATDLKALAVPQDAQERPKKRTKGLDSILEEMGELWDQAQYDSLGRSYDS